MVDTPKVAALMPAAAQGETDDRPKPTPRISRISDNAAAAAAPASTALHDTAWLWAEGSASSAGAVARERAGSLKVAVGVRAMLGSPVFWWPG